MQVEDRRIGRALGLDESIAEAREESFLRGAVGPDGESLTLGEHHLAEVVDAMGMVGMIVGVEHGIEPGHAGIEKLIDMSIMVRDP